MKLYIKAPSDTIAFQSVQAQLNLTQPIKIGNLGHFGLENLGNSFQKVFIRYVLIYILIQKSIFQ